jgi:hypothetical protein
MNRHIALAAWVLVPGLSFADGPWLPEPGATDFTLSYLTQSTDEFFLGEMQASLPEDFDQETIGVQFSYGISDRLALDIASGWSRSEFIVAPPLANDAELDGINDTRVRLRYLALDEFQSGGVTLTFSAALLIEGDYEVGALNAIGDGASGLEGALSLGHIFSSGLWVAGEAGYRYQNHDVPNEWFGSVDLGYTITPRLTARLGYALVNAVDGIDIGGPGFTPARFPEVEEDYGVFSAGVGFSVTDRFSLSIDYGNQHDGRNTVKTDIWALNATFGW